MVNVINSWAKGIILAIVLAGIIEMILPEGKNKKYVKTIIGVYILFVLIHPIISRYTNKNTNFNIVVDDIANRVDKYKIDNLTLETNSYIEETYVKKIENDIRSRLLEKNYNIDYMQIDLNMENQYRYGEINGISLHISKEDKVDKSYTNTVSTVNEVKIEISNSNIHSNTSKENNLSEQDIISLKEYLSTIYGIQKENININGGLESV